MTLCEKIFAKALYDLTLDDLNTFFSTPQRENTYLEFKAGDITLEKIYREVCALLNTDGGLLILGAPKESVVEKETVCTGQLTPCTHILSQDRLMQSIAGNISPSPTGIRVQSWNFKDGNVFVLDIPQSFNPPHQVNTTGIYYVRLEREARPAPHGFVEALFNRRRRSDLKVNSHVFTKPEPLKVLIEISLQNLSVVHTEKIGYVLELDGVKEITRTVNFKRTPETQDDYVNAQEVMDALLVKGMSYVFGIHCFLRQPVFYGRFTYYSNDSSMEFIEFLYDTKKNSFLHGVNSKYPLERSHPHLEEPKGVVRQNRKQHMAEMLRLSVDLVPDKMLEKQLDDIEDKLDFRLPDSLRMLYEVVGVNTYVGRLGEHHIQVCAPAALDIPIGERFGSESSYRMLAFVDESYPIYLSVDDPKNILFVWEPVGDVVRGIGNTFSTCLFDVLEDWAR